MNFLTKLIALKSVGKVDFRFCRLDYWLFR